MNETKKCKYCQTEIDKKSKICPICRKKQKGKLGFIIIGIIMILLIGSQLGDDKDGTKQASTPGNSSSKQDTDTKDNKDTDTKDNKDTDTKETEKPIEYTVYEVSEMMDDLDANALKAEKKYKDQYVEITGRLSTIDSSGKYISLLRTDEEYTFIGVQCYIKSDDQTEKVMEMTTGDTITLKGKIKSIGEILGYSLDITEID